MAVLNCFLVHGPGKFEMMCVNDLRTITARDTKRAKGKWLYRGELEAQLGPLQANQFIEQGKYQRDEDSDGDSIYMKVQKQNIRDHERTRTMECKKQARIAKDEDMESMMAQIDAWFESNEPGQGSAGAPKPPMKKPARAPKALPDPNVPGPGDLPPLGHEPDPAILAKQKGQRYDQKCPCYT